MRFNEKLRLLREARGWTQAELADRANVSRAAISLYESGARRVAYDDAPMLATALGVDKSVFDREELWTEYEEALAQAKQILLGQTANNTPEPRADNTARQRDSLTTIARRDQISSCYQREITRQSRKALAARV